MVFNSSSRLPDSWCLFLFFSNATKSTSVYYQLTFTVCVVISLLAPIVVAGNVLIMTAIWRNPPLRTPSYVLLAGLAFTDFCTGLVSGPFFVMYKLGDLAGNRKMFCLAGVISESAGYYFSSLTVIVMTIIAVERWLHMSRRNFLTVRRVVTLYITAAALLILLVYCHMYKWYNTNEFFSALAVVFILGAALCFILSVFAYFKVFQIIRQHQRQVQTNRNVIDMTKYKRSVSTILYILAIFLLSYLPFVCCFLVISVMDDFEDRPSRAALNACAAIAFSTSFYNPLLYYWRIKEIRDSVRSLVRNFCCQENEEES